MVVDDVVHRIARAFPSRAALCTFFICAAAQSAAAQGAPLLQFSDALAGAASTAPVEIAIAQARAARLRELPLTRPSDPRLQIGVMNRSLPGLGPMAPLDMTQLQLMQMIPLPGKLRLAGVAGQGRVRAANARRADAAWQARAAAADAYLEAFALQETVAAMKVALARTREMATVAAARYAAGDGEQAEVLRAQVETGRMEASLLQMDGMRRGALARLEQVSGRSRTEVSVVTLGETGTGAELPLLASPALPDTLATADVLLRTALIERPMLRAVRGDAEAARGAERLARRERWPDVEVGVQYGRRGGMDGTEHMGSLMAGVSLPIFANRRQVAMRDEAAAMTAMADAEWRAMRDETQTLLLAARARWTAAASRAQLYEHTLLPQGEAAVRSALGAYRSGRMPFAPVLESAMLVAQLQQERIDARRAMGQATAELEMLVGQVLFPGTRPPADTNDEVPR